jgi:hypothetical protein
MDGSGVCRWEDRAMVECHLKFGGWWTLFILRPDHNALGSDVLD